MQEEMNWAQIEKEKQDEIRRLTCKEYEDKILKRVGYVYDNSYEIRFNLDHLDDIIRTATYRSKLYDDELKKYDGFTENEEYEIEGEVSYNRNKIKSVFYIVTDDNGNKRHIDHNYFHSEKTENRLSEKEERAIHDQMFRYYIAEIKGYVEWETPFPQRRTHHTVLKIEKVDFYTKELIKLFKKVRKKK